MLSEKNKEQKTMLNQEVYILYGKTTTTTGEILIGPYFSYLLCTNVNFLVLIMH